MRLLLLQVAMTHTALAFTAFALQSTYTTRRLEGRLALARAKGHSKWFVLHGRVIWEYWRHGIIGLASYEVECICVYLAIRGQNLTLLYFKMRLLLLPRLSSLHLLQESWQTACKAQEFSYISPGPPTICFRDAEFRLL